LQLPALSFIDRPDACVGHFSGQYDPNRSDSFPKKIQNTIGPHFAAAEEPELLARDIAAFFAEI